jgi:hypothetical protein
MTPLSPFVRSRSSDLTPWGRAAALAVAVSLLGYAIQFLFDHVAAPGWFKAVEFWGLFYATAVIAFLVGSIAAVQGWRLGRRNSTLVWGLVAVAWLVVVQTIQFALDTSS